MSYGTRKSKKACMTEKDKGKGRRERWKEQEKERERERCPKALHSTVRRETAGIPETKKGGGGKKKIFPLPTTPVSSVNSSARELESSISKSAEYLSISKAHPAEL